MFMLICFVGVTSALNPFLSIHRDIKPEWPNRLLNRHFHSDFASYKHFQPQYKNYDYGRWMEQKKKEMFENLNHDRHKLKKMYDREMTHDMLQQQLQQQQLRQPQLPQPPQGRNIPELGDDRPSFLTTTTSTFPTTTKQRQYCQESKSFCTDLFQFI